MTGRRLRLLDMFCGAGGCSMGYHRAGFDVVGVDIKPQPRFPFPFHQADALEFVAAHGHEFDAIHASPPCQAYTGLANIWKYDGKHPDLVAATRAALEATAVPWVMENVVGAPLRTGIILCGAMFGLRVYRHRLFESSVLLFQPPHPRHEARASYGRIPTDDEFFTVSGHFGDLDGAMKAMGIDWMCRTTLAQAIPPTYTEYIGRQLITYLDRLEAA